MWKERELIMLSTFKETTLFLAKDKINMSMMPTPTSSPGYGQHIYILSDDEIKKEDHAYVKNRAGAEFIDKVSKITDKGLWTNGNRYFYPYKVDDEITCKKNNRIFRPIYNT